MINIIIFYLIVICYFLYLYLYIKRKFINNKWDHSSEEIKRFNRNVLLVSVLTVFISFELLFKTSNEESIPQSNIGIALATGTFIFYTVFLIWDVLKHKITQSLNINEINVENAKFLNVSSTVVISSISILILEVVLSIMLLIGGI